MDLMIKSSWDIAGMDKTAIGPVNPSHPSINPPAAAAGTPAAASPQYVQYIQRFMQSFDQLISRIDPTLKILAQIKNQRQQIDQMLRDPKVQEINKHPGFRRQMQTVSDHLGQIKPMMQQMMEQEIQDENVLKDLSGRMARITKTLGNAVGNPSAAGAPVAGAPAETATPTPSNVQPSGIAGNPAVTPTGATPQQPGWGQRMMSGLGRGADWAANQWQQYRNQPGQARAASSDSIILTAQMGSADQQILGN